MQKQSLKNTHGQTNAQQVPEQKMAKPPKAPSFPFYCGACFYVLENLFNLCHLPVVSLLVYGTSPSLFTGGTEWETERDFLQILSAKLEH